MRLPRLRHPGPIEHAMGQQALALLGMLNAACTGAYELEQAAAEQFRTHPDYAIITSFPGLADLTGARMLAEIGDDRRRFANARALKAYAGSAPVPRASGKSISITHRRIKNDRLAAVGWIWATIMVVLPGPAQQHYRRRRDHGDSPRSRGPPPVQQDGWPTPPLPANTPDLRSRQSLRRSASPPAGTRISHRSLTVSGIGGLNIRYDRKATHHLGFLTLTATLTCYKKLTKSTALDTSQSFCQAVEGAGGAV